MPRFVILEHAPTAPTGKPLHWDFMLEAGGTLRTWALKEPPTAETTIEAVALDDHRIAYLDYEGPLTQDRGIVDQWDRGTFEWVSNGHDQVAVQLSGRKLNGNAVLERSSPENQWTFQFRPTG